MSVGSADLISAINTAWDASTLNATFLALRDAGIVDAEFPVLVDQDATPGHPFPYCVFEQGVGVTTDRMSGDDVSNQEIHDIPVAFRVHAREIEGNNNTAKEIAAVLIGNIMEVFGGHPVTAPTGLTLDNGNHLITQYQNDFGVKTGDFEYQWVLNYIFRLDVFVAV